MSEEREELPKFELKSIPLGGNAVKITVTNDSPIEGEGQYGTWHMWFGEVTDVSVVWGKGKDVRKENNYTGKVIFFAPDKMNENLLEAVNGKRNTVISVTKEAEETSSGKIIKRYIIEKLKDGDNSSSSETEAPSTESQIISDCIELINDGTEIDEITFLEVCKEKDINPLKGKELYRKLQEEMKK